MMFLTKVAEGMIKVEKKEIKRIRTKEHPTSHYPYTNGSHSWTQISSVSYKK